VHTSVIKRGFTIAGVAIGSAFLIGALTMAMRGLAPTASNAAAKPAAAGTLRTFNRPAHNLVKRLAVWHAPRIPRVHRHAAKPIVVTLTGPPTVVSAPQSAAPASTGTSRGYDSSDDQSGSGDE
jgi:hypothetical protein